MLFELKKKCTCSDDGAKKVHDSFLMFLFAVNGELRRPWQFLPALVTFLRILPRPCRRVKRAQINARMPL